MKKIIIVCITLGILFALSACNESEGASNSDDNVFTIEEIQSNPANHMGAITLVGVVGTSRTQAFSLQNEDGTFEVLVNYRGNQALPQVGDVISVQGQLSENRPCCGGGFTITSTQFRTVE